MNKDKQTALCTARDWVTVSCLQLKLTYRRWNGSVCVCVCVSCNHPVRNEDILKRDSVLLPWIVRLLKQWDLRSWKIPRNLTWEA